MKYFAILSFFILLSVISISSAFPSVNVNPLIKRNQCSCSFAIASFDSDKVKGVVTFSQDESGHTEVAGVFGKGLEDTNASYGFRIVDECKNVLFDLTDELNIKPNDCGGSKTFRHKFTNMNIDCDSNGILTKTIHNSKRNCHNDKLRKRLPNGSEFTKNGEGSDYSGLSK